MVGLVDEEEGGIVGYFMDPKKAYEIAADLNRAHPVEDPEDQRFWVHDCFDANNIRDLKETVAQLGS